MKKGLTELVFILDRSGSMGGLEKDTIGGFNSMLRKQKELEGECRLTTILFDNNIKLLHDRVDIQAVEPITEKDYYVCGSTALYDAMGMAMAKVTNAQKHTGEAYRADHVLFVVITDGYENSSKEYTADDIKTILNRHKKQDGWEFIYLGANVDAKVEAEEIGIDKKMAQNYCADEDGIALNLDVMDKTVEAFRSCGRVPDNWNVKINEDYKKRGKKD